MRQTRMASATLSAAPQPVRLRPAPRFEPPYDDEPAVDRVRQGQPGPLDVELPLDWDRAEADPTPRRSAGRARKRRSRRQPASGAMSAELRLTIQRFVEVYLEVLNERRPLRHLRPLLTDEIFHDLQWGLTRRRRSWWPVPPPPGHVVRRAGGSRTPDLPTVITVRRVRCCRPASGVVEVAAVLRRGDQARAMGFRLEHEDSGWLCTALEFVA